ncbi:FG-GAP-like repeat-containing protein [Schlesneria sp. T3-172]|uniref:FG-GAP-like repeat-containing protein n=1 Tax=Schlesneria sphaerica TaxID=3373610 RepID=UPI0037C7BC50
MDLSPPPTSHDPRPRFVLLGILTLLIAGVGFLFWNKTKPAPARPPEYEEYVRAFQLGVAALDADLPQTAEPNLTRAVTLIPSEPAAWANRGLLYLRTGRMEEAASDLERADKLQPNDPEIQKLLGLLRQRQGQFTEAKKHLRQALSQDPTDVKALYLLAQIVEQEQELDSDEEYQKLLDGILAESPQNLRVLIDRLRKAVRAADRKVVDDTVVRFNELSPKWLDRTRREWNDIQPLLAGTLGPTLVPRLLRFDNVLKAEPRYVTDVAEVQPKDELAGTSLQSFRTIPDLQHSPAPYDPDLKFTASDISGTPEGRWSALQPVWLSAEGLPVVFVANEKEVRRIGDDGVLPSIPVSNTGLVPIDWNNDQKTDLLVTGPGGLRFFQQENATTWVDVTSKTGLPDIELNAANFSALAADVDLDGDVDLLISRTTGPPQFLRNNFDGTWTSQTIFNELSGPVIFTWADFDHDGAPDAGLVDSDGALRVFSNDRSGQFKAWLTPPPAGKYLTISVGDVTDDGIFDIIALRDDGTLLAFSDRHKQAEWQIREITRWDGTPTSAPDQSPQLLVADLDNNGVLDFVVSGSQTSTLWLGTGHGNVHLLTNELPPRITAAADLDGTGRLALLGLDENGHPVQLRSSGRYQYHWLTVRPHASPEGKGDNRINSFAIGGDVEVRAGTHVVKVPIQSPAVHVGLGDRPQAEVVKIQWPNGTIQFEFNSAINQTVVAQQRLKGSCPFLFARNGDQIEFVTDFMWSTPLGMYINASDKGGFLQTTDWVNVPGNLLGVQNGQYELRVNANLWETHFFDYLALMVVDHPENSEMFVDERFFMQPTEPNLILTSPPVNVARVTDDQGRDATADLQANDGVYFDHIQRGQYQGVATDHWVEIELGDDTPKEGPVWLVARGWMHPTDSSVNYAIEQGQHAKPQGLALEVPDDNGQWRVVRDQIGFPTGKNKTILLRLDGLVGEASIPPRRFRLRTNLEIYWDSLRVAQGYESSPERRQILTATSASLNHRGILAMTQANPSSPELPHYNQIVSRGQSWRDLIGYHTRYGEIDELLQVIDDRYVIMNAGDEMTLFFYAPPDPPAGWKRNYVWIADGWVKDGDFNTRFGKTVLPLPAHDMPGYDTPPGQLEDDPVYQRHPEDWQQYHTRYVTPQVFEQGLRHFKHPRQSKKGGNQ